MEHKQHEKNDEEAQETPEAPRDHYLDGDPEKDAETLARVGPEDTVFVRGRISTDIEAIDDLTCARLYVHSRVTVDGLYNAQVDQLTVSGVVQDVYGLSGNSTVSPDTDLTASGRHRAFVKITEYGMIRSLVNSAVSSLAGTGGAGATARVVEVNDCDIERINGVIKISQVARSRIQAVTDQTYIDYAGSMTRIGTVSETARIRSMVYSRIDRLEHRALVEKTMRSSIEHVTDLAHVNHLGHDCSIGILSGRSSVMTTDRMSTIEMVRGYATVMSSEGTVLVVRQNGTVSLPARSDVSEMPWRGVYDDGRCSTPGRTSNAIIPALMTPAPQTVYRTVPLDLGSEELEEGRWAIGEKVHGLIRENERLDTGEPVRDRFTVYTTPAEAREAYRRSLRARSEDEHAEGVTLELTVAGSETRSWDGSVATVTWANVVGRAPARPRPSGGWVTLDKSTAGRRRQKAKELVTEACGELTDIIILALSAGATEQELCDRLGISHEELSSLLSGSNTKTDQADNHSNS